MPASPEGRRYPLPRILIRALRLVPKNDPWCRVGLPLLGALVVAAGAPLSAQAPLPPIPSVVLEASPLYGTVLWTPARIGGFAPTLSAGGGVPKWDVTPLPSKGEFRRILHAGASVRWRPGSVPGPWIAELGVDAGLGDTTVDGTYGDPGFPEVFGVVRLALVRWFGRLGVGARLGSGVQSGRAFLWGTPILVRLALS